MRIESDKVFNVPGRQKYDHRKISYWRKHPFVINENGSFDIRDPGESGLINYLFFGKSKRIKRYNLIITMIYEGYTYRAIAIKLKISSGYVGQLVNQIKNKWEREL